MSRWFAPSLSPCDLPASSPLLNFYREEFLKHLEVLHQQRECFSDRAFSNAEQALDRILTQLDALCTRQNAGEVVSRLLASIDRVTGVSACCDRTKVN